MYNEVGINKESFVDAMEEMAFKIGESADVAHGYMLSAKNLDHELEGDFQVVESILRSAIDRVYQMADKI